MDTAMPAEGVGFHSQFLQEPERLPPNNVPHTTRLLPQEIDCTSRRESEIDSDGAKALHPTPVVEIHTGKPMRLKVKVHIPVKDHPNFNFVGKLLGPKGKSLKQLQEITQTRMAIFGRGSMRDKQKEEELRLQDDPKYHHLREDLHVEITAFAPPAEAYQRLAMALTEVKRFLVPDYFDDIRQQQLRELGVLSEKKSMLKTLDSSSNQGSPIYENEDPSELLETGRATISYPSVIKRHHAIPYKQRKHINSTEDYQEDSSPDFAYQERTNRFCHQKPRNGICKEGDSYSTNHEYMFETGTFNGYIQEENTATGNTTYGDDIDISCTSEELNDEQCVPPRRPFPAAAPRNPVIFRSMKFRNHPYNSPHGYR